MLNESCTLRLENTLSNKDKYKILSKLEIMCDNISDEQWAWFCSLDKKLEWSKTYTFSLEECSPITNNH